MNQYVSWNSQRHHWGEFIYISSSAAVWWLSLFKVRMWIILSVYHCVSATLVYTHTCNCLPNLCMFNLSGSLSSIMNNLLSVSQPVRGVCEPLFLAQTYLPNFLPFLPLSILPSFLPSTPLPRLPSSCIYWTFDKTSK